MIIRIGIILLFCIFANFAFTVIEDGKDVLLGVIGELDGAKHGYFCFFSEDLFVTKTNSPVCSVFGM